MMMRGLSGYDKYLGTSVNERWLFTYFLSRRTCIASVCISGVLFIMIIALPGGCTHLLKQDAALRNAIKQGRISGITPRDIPWEEVAETDQDDAGEFSKLDILNVYLAMPDYTTLWWSVVFGRNRADGKWKIIRVAQYQGAKLWVPLHIVPGKNIPSTAASSGGCSVDEQGYVLKSAIKEGRIPTVKVEDCEKTMVYWTWPECHKGEFSSVDIRNLDIHKSDETLEHWSVVFGLSRSDGRWKVIRVAKWVKDKEWQSLLVPEPRPEREKGAGIDRRKARNRRQEKPGRCGETTKQRGQK